MNTVLNSPRRHEDVNLPFDIRYCLFDGCPEQRRGIGYSQGPMIPEPTPESAPNPRGRPPEKEENQNVLFPPQCGVALGSDGLSQGGIPATPHLFRLPIEYGVPRYYPQILPSFFRMKFRHHCLAKSLYPPSEYYQPILLLQLQAHFWRLVY